MQTDKTKKRFSRRQATAWAAGVALLALAAAGAVFLHANGQQSEQAALTFVVQEGPLRISVIESGTIQARDQVIIKNQVDKRTTILYLVPEGTEVKKGDLLVELDASELLDEKINQEIDLQSDEAEYIRAQEELAVARNQAESDVDKAELRLEFAEQDLKRYLKGEYQNQIKEAESQITLVTEELRTAEKRLEWSKILYDEKYLSETEYQIDELAVKKRKLDLELAENSLELLQDYTHPRNVARLESDVKQAKMALQRAKRKAKADVVRAEAKLRAREATFNREKDKLAKIEEQIANTKIHAPFEGLVIYATSAKRSSRSSREPLAEGQEVYKRQELIYLPTVSSVKADIKIHETNLEKVSEGMPVMITVEALPGRRFTGRLANIALLPDAQSIYLNPDLKVYNAEVYLDGDAGKLRAGMTCRAEIIVEEYEKAVYVPIQAVMRVGGEPTVFVKQGKDFQPRNMEIGLDNNRMVRVRSGLTPGEVVLLTPPLMAGSAPMVASETAIGSRGQRGQEGEQTHDGQSDPTGNDADE
jgi:HlyD family secretion protein